MGHKLKKMKKDEDLKIVKLTFKEMLLYLVDANVFALQIFDRHSMYRKNINDYWDWRSLDHLKFSQNIYRLKKSKLIKIYQSGKEKYLELTPRGLKKVKKFVFDELKIIPPKTWDKKWRIVIFDIPDDKKITRNILREKLKKLGFLLLQESVFIHPFDCKKEIDFIVNNFYIKPYVKYIIADILEGDDELISEFIDQGILKPTMLR